MKNLGKKTVSLLMVFSILFVTLTILNAKVEATATNLALNKKVATNHVLSTYPAKILQDGK